MQSMPHHYLKVAVASLRGSDPPVAENAGSRGGALETNVALAKPNVDRTG